LTPAFSALLDLLRFSAACIVFVHHFEHLYKIGGLLGFLASFGHDVVMLFFIQSGFVIGFVAHERERDIKSYATARLARLYSVVFPALLLVALLWSVGASLQLAPYKVLTPLEVASRLGTGLLFLGQSWQMYTIPTNGPFWSVCYEAWYYIIFGCVFYLRGWRRVLLALGAALVAGPPILLLMPVWGLGYLLYRMSQKRSPSVISGALLVLVSVGAYGAMRVSNIDDLIVEWSLQMWGSRDAAIAALGFSKRYVSDYLIAILFAAMLYGLRPLSEVFQAGLLRIKQPAAMLAGYTFALYLAHQPLLDLATALAFPEVFTLLAVPVAVIAFAKVSEQKKQAWRAMFAKLIQPKVKAKLIAEATD
jgi:peptidoglycan/LPS O-acetylase OafA/YrhL